MQNTYYFYVRACTQADGNISSAAVIRKSIMRSESRTGVLCTRITADSSRVRRKAGRTYPNASGRCKATTRLRLTLFHVRRDMSELVGGRVSKSRPSAAERGVEEINSTATAGRESRARGLFNSQSVESTYVYVRSASTLRERDQVWKEVRYRLFIASAIYSQWERCGIVAPQRIYSAVTDLYIRQERG